MKPLAQPIRFGKLLVVSRAPSVEGRSMWQCVCDCGNRPIVRGYDLWGGRRRRRCYACNRRNWERNRAGIIERLFEAKSTAEIAKEMGVCVRTVKMWVKRLGGELGIDHRRYILKVRIVYLLSRVNHEDHLVADPAFIGFNGGADQRAMSEPTAIM